MATWEHELADPPSEPRALELWLQHAAGFIVWEDVRKYAREQVNPVLPAEVRTAVEKGGTSRKRCVREAMGRAGGAVRCEGPILARVAGVWRRQPTP